MGDGLRPVLRRAHYGLRAYTAAFNAVRDGYGHKRPGGPDLAGGHKDRYALSVPVPCRRGGHLLPGLHRPYNGREDGDGYAHRALCPPAKAQL